VTVPAQHVVRAYDKSGKLLRTITGQSIANAPFDIPMGIAYDPLAKEIVVSDLNRPLVVRFPAAEQ